MLENLKALFENIKELIALLQKLFPEQSQDSNNAQEVLIKDDSTILEKEPLENLAKDKQLVALKHYDFWQCMDTPRDRQLLEEYLKSKNS